MKRILNEHEIHFAIAPAATGLGSYTKKISTISILGAGVTTLTT